MDNCIFCKIANGIIPSATVYEDDDFREVSEADEDQEQQDLLKKDNKYYIIV